MDRRYKWALFITVLGFAVSVITVLNLSASLGLLIAPAVSLGTIYWLGRRAVRDKQNINKVIHENTQVNSPTVAPNHEEKTIEPSSQEIMDPFWGPLLEYTHVIQETVISEGQKNTLDNEIVDKVLSLLSRVTRLIPQLKELNDSGVNHNIQRLVFKDLNGAINPFLKLSGEGKRLNRRLLLDGIKDINSKLSSYVETIEQKDLIELQTRMDLIQKRYRSTD